MVGGRHRPAGVEVLVGIDEALAVGQQVGAFVVVARVATDRQTAPLEPDVGEAHGQRERGDERESEPVPAVTCHRSTNRGTTFFRRSNGRSTTTYDTAASTSVPAKTAMASFPNSPPMASAGAPAHSRNLMMSSSCHRYTPYEMSPMVCTIRLRRNRRMAPASCGPKTPGRRKKNATTAYMTCTIISSRSVN